MEKLIQHLQEAYPDQIASINKAGSAEINISLHANADAAQFSQSLQDHIVALTDEFTILKVNILDEKGGVKDSFATNQ